jgi:hypothetical protein
MFLIVIEGRESEGAYAATDELGNNVLYIFEEKDDAVRFAMLLEEDNFPKMTYMKVEKDVIMEICKSHDYEYRIFTCDDIVIPPQQENTDFI